MVIKQDCVRLVIDATDKDNLNYERKKTMNVQKSFQTSKSDERFSKIATRQRGLKHFRDEIV